MVRIVASTHRRGSHARLLRIIAIAMPENRPSLRVMEKLGMTYERATEKEGFPVVVYSRHFSASAPQNV